MRHSATHATPCVAALRTSKKPSVSQETPGLARAVPLSLAHVSPLDCSDGKPGLTLIERPRAGGGSVPCATADPITGVSRQQTYSLSPSAWPLPGEFWSPVVRVAPIPRLSDTEAHPILVPFLTFHMNNDSVISDTVSSDGRSCQGDHCHSYQTALSSDYAPVSDGHRMIQFDDVSVRIAQKDLSEPGDTVGIHPVLDTQLFKVAHGRPKVRDAQCEVPVPAINPT